MAKSFREIVAWQLGFELKEKVIKIVAASPGATSDFKYRDQIHDSCRSVPRNIAEGYGRYRPSETSRYLEFAMASLEETENHLRDGVGSGYFDAEEVGPLIRLAARCRTAMINWHAYLLRVRHDPRFQPPPKPRKRKNPRDEPS